MHTELIHWFLKDIGTSIHELCHNFMGNYQYSRSTGSIFS